MNETATTIQLFVAITSFSKQVTAQGIFKEIK